MKRILLIEPDWPLAKSISSYLRRRGFDVRWQPDAEGGIESADKYLPSLVLLQLQLPVHSGIEFLYEFRSYSDWTNIPVVLYGNIEKDKVGHESSWQQLGVSEYLRLQSGSLDQVVRAIEGALVRVGV